MLFEQAQHDRAAFHTMPSEAHFTTWVTEAATEFVTAERDREKPFFLLLNYFDPHHPFEAPAEYRELYDASTLVPPIGSPYELDGKPPIHKEASRESHAGNAPGFLDYTADEIQEIRATYFAMISQIDAQVGRLLSTLDELGLRENTLVVFTSDHGEMLGDHSLLLKSPLFYEGAVRVPLIMRWPARLPRLLVTDIVQWMDLGATVLDAAGLPPMAGSQAQSLLPQIAGHGEPRNWALCEYRDSCFPYDPPVHGTMLRWGHHKLVVYHGTAANGWTRSGELYDLAADPNELDNLWHDPGHSETRSQMEAALLDVLVATEDRSRRREVLF